MKNQVGGWQASYDGVYVLTNAEQLSEVQRSSPEAIGAVIVGENFNTGGSTLEVHELSPSTFRGKWNVDLSEGLSFENPEDALVDFVKCPSH
ncbi:MAG: hypothetical protein AAFQ63_14305 [Cyanobacteria bacterium J06621_11]